MRRGCRLRRSPDKAAHGLLLHGFSTTLRMPIARSYYCFGSSVCELTLIVSYFRNPMADNSKQGKAIAVTCKCGEELPSKTKLYIHSKTCHPHKCEQCDVRCKTKTELEKHVKGTHRKRFICDLCPEDEPPLMSENALINHQQRQHDVAILCSLCGVSFTDAYHRDRHTREKHNGVAERRCDCGQAFAQKSNFDRHQDICILSKRGATKAIKRRFEQLVSILSSRSML